MDKVPQDENKTKRTHMVIAFSCVILVTTLGDPIGTINTETYPLTKMRGMPTSQSTRITNTEITIYNNKVG